MKSILELHGEVWKTATSKWLFRVATVIVVLTVLNQLVLAPLIRFYETNSIQTWGMFARSWAEMARSGINMSVPSSHQFWSMTWSSGFQLFLELLFGGMFMIGVATVATKAVRREDDGWFGSAFVGFKAPLEMLWVNVRYMVMLIAWVLPAAIATGVVFAFAANVAKRVPDELAFAGMALLGLALAVPVVAILVFAMLRYALVWYVKSDHQEYTAGKCLAESARMMAGHKLELLAYWLTFSLLAIPVFAMVAMSAVLVNIVPPAGAICGAVAFVAMILAVAYVTLGQAVYYDEINRISKNQNTENPNADESAASVES